MKNTVTQKSMTTNNSNKITKNRNNQMTNSNFADHISLEVDSLTTQKALYSDIQRKVEAMSDSKLLEWTGIAQLTAFWLEVGDIDWEKWREPIISFSIPPTPLYLQHLSDAHKRVLLVTLIDWMQHLIKVIEYKETDGE